MGSNSSVLSLKEAQAILTQEDTGCLCLCKGNQPYAVPVSYAYLDGEILIHSSPEGKKLDVIRENHQACFVVSRNPDRTKPHQAQDGCSFRYESVLCFGTARLVDEPGERLAKLKAFKDYFYKRLKLDPQKDPVTEKAAEHAACVVITIKEITGKKKEPKRKG